MNDICAIKGCNRPSYITYLEKSVCEYHWDRHCEHKRFNLKVALGIQDSPSRLPVALAASVSRDRQAEVHPGSPE